MTYEEVKKIFRTKFLGTCCIDFENGDGTNECECPNTDCDNCRIAEAERMILEALKKQIPKKPIKVRCTNGRFSYICPMCNTGLLSKCGCQNNGCRQAIDWSEVE